MSSTTENQQEDLPRRNDSVSTSKDFDSALLSNSGENMQPPVKETDNTKDDLVTEIATLKLANGNVVPGKEANEKTVNKISEDKTVSPPTVEVNENTNPKLAPETAHEKEHVSSNSTKTNQEATQEATTSESDKPNLVRADETDTPRLTTYINLHNDMMTSKSAITTNAAEQSRLYHHASHVARTLLASKAKYSDLPLVIHAHACMVLACSDEDDCCERMEEGLELIKRATVEGLLNEKEWKTMLVSFEAVMEMKGRVPGGEDGEGSSASEDGEGSEDGGREEVFELP